MISALLAIIIAAQPVPAQSDVITVSDQFQTQSFTITDGDTIRLDDGTRVRLNGFNAPESIKPQCQREAILGERAKDRLAELSTTGRTHIEKIDCSCRPGTEGTDRCNYGRSCGRLTINGRDVGEILISEGLAVPFVCGPTKCPRTPRPWCGS